MFFAQILIPVCFSLTPTRAEIVECAIELSKLHGIKPEYTLAVIDIESAFDVDAHNLDDPAGGSIGLMQLLYPTAQDMGYRGSREHLFLPFENINFGITYFKRKLRQYKGDALSAAAAYNAGRVKRVKGQFFNSFYVQRFKRKRLKWSKWLKRKN